MNDRSDGAVDACTIQASISNENQTFRQQENLIQAKKEKKSQSQKFTTKVMMMLCYTCGFFQHN